MSTLPDKNSRSTNSTSRAAIAQQGLAVFGAIYALGLGLLAIPAVQRHALFAHYVQWPINPRFNHPEEYGLNPSKTLNLKIQTPDNVRLGAWFTLAEPAFQALCSLGRPLSPKTQDIHHALSCYTTVLYFHGNASSRATSFRAQVHSLWSAKLSVNVLAIDYRGYADSEGVPSEDGLKTDGLAAWEWAIENGARPENILLVGHSLGTGVVSKVAHSLSEKGVSPKGVILVAGFTSMAKLLETYRLGGVIPLMLPLRGIPMAFTAVDYLLEHKFNTLSILPDITCPILFVHSQDDWDISAAHSQALYDSLIESHLSSASGENQTAPHEQTIEPLEQVDARRAEVRQNIETVLDLGHVGSITNFTRRQSDGGQPVTFFKAKLGGHNNIIVHEATMDVVRDTFGL